jgi:hypothetical protein
MLFLAGDLFPFVIENNCSKKSILPLTSERIFIKLSFPDVLVAGREFDIPAVQYNVTESPQLLKMASRRNRSSIQLNEQ